MFKSTSHAGNVARIDACPLPQWRVCHRNPVIGVKTEIAVKQSFDQSLARQHLRGTVRLHEGKEKRDKPDIYIECCGRSLSADCKHYTATVARHGRIYSIREFYGHQRGEDTLTTFLRDEKRFLFVAFELMMTDGRGHKARRLVMVPGKWLKARFEGSTEAGISIDLIADLWPSYGKNGKRLYDIDIWELIEISEHEEAWP